jgi:hypothetical protein
VITAVDGTFSLGSLRQGSYIIKAFGNNVESDDIPVRVRNHKISFVEIWLDTYMIDEKKSIEEENNGIDEM